MPHQSVETFGEFLMLKLRDNALESFESLRKGRERAPSLQKLQADLATLSKTQQEIVQRTLVSCLDSGLHDFLFALQERRDFEADISLTVNGVDIVDEEAGQHEGIHYELFDEDGWFAKYSDFGEPPPEA